MADVQRGDIPFLSVAELGRRIRAREVSPVEATEAYLERIGRIDSRLNSYITVCADEARQAAAAVEREIAAGRYLGPLHGIPVAVKDQFDTVGIRTTYGSALEWDHVPTEDAVVVAKLKEAGAVLLGKLNLSEFALGESFHHPGGQPRNPWDLSRNPRHLQQRVGGGHGGVPVRHSAGRGHRRLDAHPGSLERADRAAPNVGAGKSARGSRGVVVNGYGGANLPLCRGLRADLPGHRGV